MLRSFLICTILFFGFSFAQAAEKIRFAITDIEGLEVLQQEFGAFKKELEKITGFDIELFHVNSRTAAVEALTSKQVDFVLTGPAEYVVIKELTNAKVVAGWQRPDYFAQVVVLSNGPIKQVADLKGKKIAFGAVGSTSQHLGPAQALSDLGLAYTTDYQPQIISRNVAVEAMIRGDIAAVGMNFAHLASVRKAYPEIAFTVVARSRDLPNDVLVAHKDVPEATVQKVQAAFQKDGKALMQAVLLGNDNKKYAGGFFLTNINDADYDYTRAMYRTIGVETFKQFVGK